jgi:hypothetical protein
VAVKIGMQLERFTIAPPTDRRGSVDVAVMAITHQVWSQRMADQQDAAEHAE